MGYKAEISYIIQSGLWFYYLKFLILYLFITFCGIIIFLGILKTKNRYLTLGGGMITGILSWLLSLTVTSYFLKGKTGIFLNLVIFGIFVFYSFKKDKNKVIDFLRINKVSFKNLFLFVMGLIHLILITAVANNVVLGGDVTQYWGLATSFARGNYPIYLPWQPSYLAAYHVGLPIILGATTAITGISVKTSHFLFSIFIIFALFLVLLGLALEFTSNIFFALILPIMVIILYAGPVIPIGDYRAIISTLANGELFRFPLQYDLRASIGNGPTDLTSSIYLLFYPLGLASFIIFFIFVLKKINRLNSFFDYLILALLLVATLSVNEIILVPQMVILLVIFATALLSVVKSDRKELFKKVPVIFKSYAFLLFVFFIFFFIVQNLVRDSFLNSFKSHTVETSVKIVGVEHFHSKFIQSFLSSVTTSKARGILNFSGEWYFPDLRYAVVSLILLSILFRGREAFLLALGSLGLLMAAIFIYPRFGPHNGTRFVYQSYNYFVFGYALLTIILLSSKIKFRKSVGLLLILIFIPQITTSYYRLLTLVRDKRGDNLVNAALLTNSNLMNLARILNTQDRLLYVDKFPYDKTLYSPTTLEALVYYGLFIPISPPYPKIISADSGIEWFDSIAFLDPKSMRELGIDYLFVENKLDDIRVQFLAPLVKNGNIIVLHKDATGTLYKIDNSFFSLPSPDTVGKVLEYIPRDSVVFIDKFKLSEIRKGFILKLNNKVKLFGPRLNIGGDWYIDIEVEPNFQTVEDYDKIKGMSFYFLTEPEKDELFVNKGFIKIYGNSFVSLWHKV